MANLIKIDSLEVSELDVYVRLTGAQLRNKLEPQKSIFIAESPEVIRVALKSGCEPVSLLTDERFLESGVKDIVERFERDYPTLPIYIASRDVLKDLTGFELTRGALCAMKRPPEKSVRELCENARRIAVFENVCDSTNIGALFRCAAAFDIDAVLLTPSCCDALSRRAVRVSMGTVFQVPFARIGKTNKDWPYPAIDELKNMCFKTVAMALKDDSYSIEDNTLKAEERLAIILGTEGDGLKEETIAKCDYTVKIPMSHGVDSLNVAAAGAVAFWELTKPSKP